MGTWNGIELEHLTLTSPRLLLRPLAMSDAPAIHDAMQDRFMHEFLPLPDPYTPKDAEYYVTSIAGEGRRAGTTLESGLVERSSGRLVGAANLRLPGRASVTAEIGYAVYPWARGNGFAAEATRSLAEWAYAHGLHRVVIRAAVGNVPSVRTALAAGFRYEGVFRDDVMTPSGPVDGAVFGRLASDPPDPIQPGPMLPVGGLSDGVVTLRIPVPSDAESIHREFNDPLTRSWAFDDRELPMSEATARAARAHLDWLVGATRAFTIVDAANGQPAGALSLRHVGPPGVANIGYGLLPEFRGRGFTARALRLMVEWAFSAGGYARLELGAKAGNVASQKAALAGGFEPDGVRVARLRNHDGSYGDEVRFALIRPELH